MNTDKQGIVLVAFQNAGSGSLCNVVRLAIQHGYHLTILGWEVSPSQLRPVQTPPLIFPLQPTLAPSPSARCDQAMD